MLILLLVRMQGLPAGMAVGPLEHAGEIRGRVSLLVAAGVESAVVFHCIVAVHRMTSPGVPVDVSPAVTSSKHWVELEEYASKI